MCFCLRMPTSMKPCQRGSCLFFCLFGTSDSHSLCVAAQMVASIEHVLSLFLWWYRVPCEPQSAKEAGPEAAAEAAGKMAVVQNHHSSCLYCVGHPWRLFSDRHMAAAPRATAGAGGPIAGRHLAPAQPAATWQPPTPAPGALVCLNPPPKHRLPFPVTKYDLTRISPTRITLDACLSATSS